MSESPRLQAFALAQSPRGQYILSQALTVAIDTLEQVPKPYREQSNIEDMRFIRDQLFPVYADIYGEEPHPAIKSWTDIET